MDNYKAQFSAEASDLLTKLEKGLLALETKPDDQILIEEIFRALHTLKGSSGMYGFTELGHLMHLTENLFEIIRRGERKIEQKIIGLALEIVDFCNTLLKIDNEMSEQVFAEYQLLLEKIKALDHTRPAHDYSENMPEMLASGNGIQTYWINFPVDQEFEKRGIRVNSLIQELEDLGQVVSVPVKSESNGEVNYWDLFLVSSVSCSDIEDVFLFLADIVVVEKLAAENLFLNNEFKQTVQKNATLKLKNNRNELLGIVERIQNEKYRKSSSGKPASDLPVNKSFLKVSSDKLDEQLNLLSELVTVKAEIRLLVESEKNTKLIKLVESLDKVTNKFRKNILNVRLVQVKQWYVLFLRLVRDISKQLGKEVEFIAEGLETEIDKNIIDSLEGPLTHLIRNCLDHGIEMPDERIQAGKPAKGSVSLKAYHSGSEIILEIGDDGRGFSKDLIQQKALSKGLITSDAAIGEKQLFDFVFLPGFSTSSEVSELSGRGVGMDVVKKAVNQLRGDIEVHSIEGEGTSFIIRLPMLLSIIDTLLIRSENQYFAIPLLEVQKCSQVVTAQLQESSNELLPLNGELLPYVNLRKVFGVGGQIPDKQKIIVVENSAGCVGLIADEVIGEYQAVLKPFDGYFVNQQYFIGASLLADGHLCVILDTQKLIHANYN